MAEMKRYVDLLQAEGHHVKIVFLRGLEMKKQRMKAAKHIFNLQRKVGCIPKDVECDEKDVDVFDIGENNTFKGFFRLLSQLSTSAETKDLRPARTQHFVVEFAGNRGEQYSNLQDMI